MILEIKENKENFSYLLIKRLSDSCVLISCLPSYLAGNILPTNLHYIQGSLFDHQASLNRLSNGIKSNNLLTTKAVSQNIYATLFIGSFPFQMASPKNELKRGQNKFKTPKMMTTLQLLFFGLMQHIMKTPLWSSKHSQYK